MSRTITFTKRLTIAIVAISIVATLVSGAILANYLLPSRVNITGQPGIALFLGDLSTNSCTSTAVTSFDYGDVQVTQVKAGPVICIQNTSAVNAYIIDANSGNGQHITSITTSPSPLPTGMTLSWNFHVNTINGVQDCSALGGTMNGNCQLLGAGQETSPITISLAIDSSASTGVVTFTEVYQAFDSVNG